MVIFHIVFIDVLYFNDHLGNKSASISASIRQTALNKNFLTLEGRVEWRQKMYQLFLHLWDELRLPGS